MSSIIIYIYTKDYPKADNGKPWQKGDEALSPYEVITEPKERLTIYERLRQSPWYTASQDIQEQALETLLSHYLHEDEVKHYMRQIRLKAGRNYDSYVQVMQVVQDKEKQPKFKNGTDSYRRNSIIRYALQKNLQEFGWSLEPMDKKKSWKAVEPDLFGR